MALNKNNKLQRAHKKLSKKDFYYCPACKNKVYLKTGQIISPHFAHYQKKNCQSFSEGETEEHLKGKIALANYFKSYGGKITLEAYLPKLKQRPDILIEKDKEKIAIEFQCSPISIQKITERTNGYLGKDYDILWILGKRFRDKKSFTSFDKACLYFKSKNERFLLFHYDVEEKKLMISYDYQVNTKGKVISRIKKIKTEINERISLEEKTQSKEGLFDFNVIKEKQESLIKNSRYPSEELLSFLALIYKNNDNIISLPKEIFLHLPSEWFIQTDHMIWKYRLVLWIENHLIKEIITIKRLRKWLRKEIERKEIIFYKIQKIHEELLLKVIMEFITLLVQQDILKRRSKGKWLYQKPLKRYKNLNEKYK